MKKVYPVVLIPAKPGYVVYVPDLQINTQGEDISDAISMARDAIGLWGITQQDYGKKVPQPSDMSAVSHKPEEIVTLVDIDFDEYRKSVDMKVVRKNVTIPSWLNDLAIKSGVNFSQVLQDGLKDRLQVKNR